MRMIHAVDSTFDTPLFHAVRLNIKSEKIKHIIGKVMAWGFSYKAPLLTEKKKLITPQMRRSLYSSKYNKLFKREYCTMVGALI